MQQPTKRFIALYTSVVILLVGHGLQLALIPLRGQALGWDPSSIGITGSLYFAGFLAGCWLIPKFVGLVGHIRVFSATTTVCCVALLLILLLDDVVYWAMLRFFTGLGISGCYIVIESWLNAQSSDSNRGRTLALYTTLVLLAMAVGQLLVNLDGALSPNLIVIGGVLLALAVIPVTLSPEEQPPAPAEVRFTIRRVAGKAPAAIGTVLIAGMMTGMLFTLTPVVTVELEFSLFATSLVLVTIVLGGAAFQYPAGKLSDHFDRRKVMVGLAGLGILPAVLPLLIDLPVEGYFVCFLLMGGVLNSFYPICLAHANDRLPGQFLEVGTAILLTNSIGAVVGPTAAALLMDLFGALAYFAFAGVFLLVILLWLVFCLVRNPQAAEHDQNYVTLAKSSPALFEIDPRVEESNQAATGQSNAGHEEKPELKS